MEQHHKLFDKAEIEYITPFMKLWMSFNNWYKKDLPDVKFDREAINKYKKQGEIKNNFLKLFNQSSDIGIDFQNALFEIVKNIGNYPIKDKKNKNIGYSENLIMQNADTRGGKEPVYISQDKKLYQIEEEKSDIFFEQTLEIIYCIRSNLVHGSFDIENQYFLKLVESTYKVLYPIMQRILQNQEDKIYHCKNRKGTNAQAVFKEGKMIVLEGSKICKEVVKSYEKPQDRENKLSNYAKEEKDYFKLNQDIDFNSPSAASSFCLGCSSNGWDDWKNNNGKTINDILR